MMKKITIRCLLFFTAFSLYAQEERTLVPELITDRPDATEAASVVPKGYLQIETGGFYTTYEENGWKEEVLGYNTTLLRFGLLSRLELRLGWNFEETQTSINGVDLPNIQSGFSPLLAGVKVAVAEEKGALPQIGLIGHLYLPFTAGSDYRPETTGVDFRFAMAHTLSERSSLGYNLGAQWGNDSPEAAYIYTLSYGYSITDRLDCYAEVYGNFPEDNKAQHLWDAGLTYLLMSNLQFDATVGTSFTEGQDLLLSAGASYRIPN